MDTDGTTSAGVGLLGVQEPDTGAVEQLQFADMIGNATDEAIDASSREMAPLVNLAPVATSLEDKPVLEIPAEFMIIGSVPRASFLSAEASAWEWEPERDDSGSVVGMKSKPAATDVLAASPVDENSLASALRDCHAHVEHNVMGSLFFKYMFRVPHHDYVSEDGKATRHAFACFVGPKGQPLPFMGAKEGRVTVYVARDPLYEGKVIAPCDLGSSSDADAKPMVLTVDPEVTLAETVTGIDASNICVVDPQTDEQRMLILFSIDLARGVEDMRALYRAQSVTPADNSGKLFGVSSEVDGDTTYEKLSLPEEARNLVQRSKHPEPDAVESNRTAHMGKRMLQIASYYFASNDDSEAVFAQDDGHAADNVTSRIASTLATLLQNNHGVRDAIIRQLFDKCGAHLFPLDVGDGQNMKVTLAAARPDDVLNLTVNMDHSYRVGIRGKDDDAARSVTLKRITVVLKLV